MDAIADCSALALAVVFMGAGVVKLRGVAATKRSFVALGLPRASVLARLVPAVELALGVALVIAPGAAAWAGLALLAAFTIVIARAVAAGVDAPCSCFGSARAQPVSTVELVRNAALGALAVIATGAGPAIDAVNLEALVLVTVSVAIVRVAFAVAGFRRAAGPLWPGLPGDRDAA